MPVRHRTFFPPSPPKWFRGLAQWEVVSSYSSATAPGSHGISCADPLFQARKELERGLATCAPSVKIIKSPTSNSAVMSSEVETSRCGDVRQCHRMESLASPRKFFGATLQPRLCSE